VKSAVRDQEGDWQEQLTFLANEKNNLTELERLIADLVISLLTRVGIHKTSYANSYICCSFGP